ncbi:MAG: site-specific DNA-methyltransferase [Flavobacteriales bacterium]|nr:site-specific DNA-methyltransferase [Flavobacteriales bacterium]
MKANTIFNESCLEGLAKMESESVDLIFTDPPYYQFRAQNVTSLKNHKDVVTEFDFDGYDSEEEYLEFILAVLQECYRVAKPGASGYFFCGDDFVSYINRLVAQAGFNFRKVIHWHKTNPFPAIHTRKMFANSMELIVHFSKGSPNTWNHKHVNEMHNFIETPICMGKERSKHKTQKPLKVCIPYIEISSNFGDLILDPFMGSGTTAVAAALLGRNYIGFELNPEYVEIAHNRLKEVQVKKIKG